VSKSGLGVGGDQAKWRERAKQTGAVQCVADPYLIDMTVGKGGRRKRSGDVVVGRAAWRPRGGATPGKAGVGSGAKRHRGLKYRRQAYASLETHVRVQTVCSPA
jgi:hypothetical protein